MTRVSNVVEERDYQRHSQLIEVKVVGQLVSGKKKENEEHWVK